MFHSHFLNELNSVVVSCVILQLRVEFVRAGHSLLPNKDWTNAVGRHTWKGIYNNILLSNLYSKKITLKNTVAIHNYIHWMNFTLCIRKEH